MFFQSEKHPRDATVTSGLVLLLQSFSTPIQELRNSGVVGNSQLLFQHQEMFPAGNGLLDPQQLHQEMAPVGLQLRAGKAPQVRWDFWAGSEVVAVPFRGHAVVVPILAQGSSLLFQAFIST